VLGRLPKSLPDGDGFGGGRNLQLFSEQLDQAVVLAPGCGRLAVAGVKFNEAAMHCLTERIEPQHLPAALDGLLPLRAGRVIIKQL
jgi:hypothetical protein